jgi:hypothetical protein
VQRGQQRLPRCLRDVLNARWLAHACCAQFHCAGVRCSLIGVLRVAVARGQTRSSLASARQRQGRSQGSAQQAATMPRTAHTELSARTSSSLGKTTPLRRCLPLRQRRARSHRHAERCSVAVWQSMGRSTAVRGAVAHAWRPFSERQHRQRAAFADRGHRCCAERCAEAAGRATDGGPRR